MPSVREEDTNEVPEKLEVVEVRPGVRLKLNAADRKALGVEGGKIVVPSSAAPEPVEYTALQERAKELGIPSNQSRAKLEKAIAAAEEEGA